MEVKLSKMEQEFVMACLNDNVEKVEQLLQEGVNANLVYNEGANTLLMAVVNRNYLSVAQKLIQYGADVNKKNLKGYTPLMAACDVLVDNDDMVNLLLNNGAKVNEVSESKATALIFASINGKTSIVRLLMF